MFLGIYDPEKEGSTIRQTAETFECLKYSCQNYTGCSDIEREPGRIFMAR